MTDRDRQRRKEKYANMSAEDRQRRRDYQRQWMRAHRAELREQAKGPAAKDKLGTVTNLQVAAKDKFKTVLNLDTAYKPSDALQAAPAARKT